MSRKASLLLVFGLGACVPGSPVRPAAGAAPPVRIAEPGYQCRFETRGDFGRIAGSFDVPRSGGAPRGWVRWEALPGKSRPVFGAEWRLTESGELRPDDGAARISVPLAPDTEKLVYISLHVRADPNPVFSNPTVIDSSMLDGGGGLIHVVGNDQYFFNVRWRNLVAFGRAHPVFYLFAVRDLALKRPVILARFEIDPASFLQADEPVRAALDKARRMIANPAQVCVAVDDLPDPPGFIQ